GSPARLGSGRRMTAKVELPMQRQQIASGRCSVATGSLMSMNLSGLIICNTNRQNLKILPELVCRLVS
ncbi:hypothetical protein, partial [Nocardia seriolae]